MRPASLPHHRTCGFPHPAVGPSRGLPSQARRPVTPNTPTGGGPSAFGLSLVSPGWRPQLSRPAVSFVLSSPVPAPRWALFGPSALRIGTPFLFVRPSSATTASADFPPPLSGGISPGQCLFCPLAPLGSTACRQWFLGFVFASTLAPAPCLSAHSCSCGRTFAFHPFAPAPCGDDLAVRLRLASQAPGGNLSSR